MKPALDANAPAAVSLFWQRVEQAVHAGGPLASFGGRVYRGFYPHLAGGLGNPEQHIGRHSEVSGDDQS